MLKQLLALIQIIIIIQAFCNLDNSITNINVHSITIINANLKNKLSDYTIANNHNNSQYALAIHGMQIDLMGQWSLIFRQIAKSSIILRFKNDYINWVKISCTIIASKRADLTLGFIFINKIKTNLNGNSTIQINYNKSLDFYETSIAFAFLNGFKIIDNNTNQRLQIKASWIKQKSIIFSIYFDNQTILENVYFSYVIFSPLKASFQSFGNYFLIQQSLFQKYIDLSESLFYESIKFYGLTGLTLNSQRKIVFNTSIDEDLILSSVSHLKIINFQYILLLPQTYDCLTCNQTVLYKSTCLDVCPNNTVIYIQNDKSYCRRCSSKLNLIISNQKCICKQQYIKNDGMICVKISQKTPQTQITDSQSIILGDSQNKFSQTMQNLNKTCDNITNSLYINNKCSCMVGYVNFSNHCVPLVSFGLTPINNFSINNPQKSHISLKSQGNACKDNQQFSITLKKCKCINGFSLSNQNLCVSLCNKDERYDQTLKKCICQNGKGKMNGQCIICSKTTNQIENQTCYFNRKGFYCLNNYYLFENFCYNCPSIKGSLTVNGTCKVCSNGFIYNGSSCICYEGNILINQICIGKICGNGKIDKNIQTCDDGNIANGDGCSSQCIIEQNYYCLNQPSFCELSICGNGQITGAQQCDDNNKINFDGCSSLCLIQDNFTCLQVPSACFKIRSGNISLLSMHANGGNAFFIFQIPFVFKNMKQIQIQQFIKQQSLGERISTSIYSQQDFSNKNRYNVLLIFSKGIPNYKTYFSFSFSHNGQTGTTIVPITKINQQNSRITNKKA